MSDSITVGITGAAGYIGSAVGSLLLEAGHDLVALDNFQAPKVESIGGCRIEEVDIRNRQAVRTAFDGVDAVMHLAAISGVPDCQGNPEAAFDTNVTGTENVAWCCRERGLPLLFAGSMAILGDPVEFPISPDHPRRPVNLYGRTKQMSEDDVHALAEDSFPAMVLMKSNIYGHHWINGERIGKGTVINKFVNLAREGRPLTVYKPGSQARDFIHLQDVARAYEHALEVVLNGEPGAQTVTIGSGECLTVMELAESVQRIGCEVLDAEPEIAVFENPREHETVTEDFTIETETAQNVIGFEAKRSVDEAVREMLTQ